MIYLAKGILCFSLLSLAACPGPGFTSDRPDNSTGGSGGGGGFSCVDSPLITSTVVNNNCGVFVAPSGDDKTGDGTRERPFATLAKAVSAAKATERRVFACSGDYSGAVTVPEGVEMFGSRDCAGAWERTKVKSVLHGAPGEIPLRLLGSVALKPTVVDGMRFEAADASAGSMSSIGALAEEEADVELIDCEIIAGAGATGDPGMDAPQLPPDPPMLATMNQGLNYDCNTSMNAGGTQHENTCANGDYSVGGSGGDGSAFTGSAGVPGSPNLGKGAGGMKNADCGVPNGGSGSNGEDGMLGSTGNGGQGDGMLSMSKGWLGAAGMNGGTGKPGQGGGGGAGQTGTLAPLMCAGPSGGSGGAGGCGGLGGMGGRAGGSSIALVSIHALVTLNGGSLQAANGGNGGKGGSAQTGGNGRAGAMGGVGDAGQGVMNGCPGGTGGAGGSGGPGGGGAGGHSLAIAYVGTPPNGSYDAKFSLGGSGGKGGPNGMFNNDGEGGKAQASLQISAVAPN